MNKLEAGDLVMLYSWAQMQWGIVGPARIVSIIEETDKVDIDGLKVIKARVKLLMTDEIMEKHVSQSLFDCIENWKKIDEERDRVIITMKDKSK